MTMILKLYEDQSDYLEQFVKHLSRCLNFHQLLTNFYPIDHFNRNSYFHLLLSVQNNQLLYQKFNANLLSIEINFFFDYFNFFNSLFLILI
jgi:hypothetical protein